MHQAQFQVLYRNFLSALVLEAEAWSSLPLLMMCWSLQRLSDKTKGITFYLVCHQPSPSPCVHVPSHLNRDTIRSLAGSSQGALGAPSAPQSLGFPEVQS